MISHSKYIVAANSGREEMEEIFGRIDKDDLIETIQDLLLEEYLQRDVYENYRYLLFGPDGIGVKEHLEEHMLEEMEHIDILQRYLVSLGGIPSTDRKKIPVPEEYSLDGLMKLNLELENNAVEKYSLIINGLSEIPEHIAIRIDLENILVQEQEHVHDLERWLKEKYNE